MPPMSQPYKRKHDKAAAGKLLVGLNDQPVRVCESRTEWRSNEGFEIMFQFDSII